MHRELRNIEVRKFFNLDTDLFLDYNNLLKYLKGKPTLLGEEAKKLESLEFGEVSTIKRNLNNPDMEGFIYIFCTVFDLKERDVYRVDVVQFYHALNWIKDKVKNLVDREVKQLTTIPDAKLKEAGIDRLNVFGELNTLIAIGERYGKTPQEIEKWEYNIVFALMYHDKITGDINRKYSKILTRK